MIYKAFLALKVIAKLLHEVFSGKLLQSITPVKHGYRHFTTLSARDYFLRIGAFVFLQVKWGVLQSKNWWR